MREMRPDEKQKEEVVERGATDGGLGVDGETAKWGRGRGYGAMR